MFHLFQIALQTIKHPLIQTISTYQQAIQNESKFYWCACSQGGTLKFSVYIGEADFFGVKILNFRNFLGFQKN